MVGYMKCYVCKGIIEWDSKRYTNMGRVMCSIKCINKIKEE